MDDLRSSARQQQEILSQQHGGQNRACPLGESSTPSWKPWPTRGHLEEARRAALVEAQQQFQMALIQQEVMQLGGMYRYLMRQAGLVF